MVQPRSKSYELSFRRKIIQEIIDNEDAPRILTTMAQKYQVSRETIKRWYLRYKQGESLNSKRFSQPGPNVKTVLDKKRIARIFQDHPGISFREIQKKYYPKIPKSTFHDAVSRQKIKKPK